MSAGTVTFKVRDFKPGEVSVNREYDLIAIESWMLDAFPRIAADLVAKGEDIVMVEINYNILITAMVVPKKAEVGHTGLKAGGTGRGGEK